MEKKYKLSDVSITINRGAEIVLYRIEAIRSFNDVICGDMGGYVESEDNLSQEDDCWIYDDSMVFNKARVSNKAVVHNNVIIYKGAIIKDNVIITDNVVIEGESIISGNSQISDNVEIYGTCNIYGNSIITNDVSLYEEITIGDNSFIADNTKLIGKITINGKSLLCGNTQIKCVKGITLNNITLIWANDITVINGKNHKKGDLEYIWVSPEQKWYTNDMRLSENELLKVLLYGNNIFKHMYIIKHIILHKIKNMLCLNNM